MRRHMRTISLECAELNVFLLISFRLEALSHRGPVFVKHIYICIYIYIHNVRGSKLGDRLTSQIVGHLTLAKQECCFWMSAERTKQVIGTSTHVFTDLCGPELVDRLPCQILGHLTLAKQDCCSWIPAERKIGTWYQRTFVVFTDLVDRLPCQISGHLILAKQNGVFGSLRKQKQVICTSTH